MPLTMHLLQASVKAHILCLMPGGYGAGVPPDPIPNSAVKPLAPMVLCLKARESRSSPGLQADEH